MSKQYKVSKEPFENCYAYRRLKRDGTYEYVYCDSKTFNTTNDFSFYLLSFIIVELIIHGESIKHLKTFIEYGTYVRFFYITSEIYELMGIANILDVLPDHLPSLIFAFVIEILPIILLIKKYLNTKYRLSFESVNTTPYNIQSYEKEE